MQSTLYIVLSFIMEKRPFSTRIEETGKRLYFPVRLSLIDLVAVI